MPKPDQLAQDLLNRLSDKMRNRDPSIVDDFSDAADAMLVGSEVGEIVHGKAELAAFFQAAFEWPVRIHWQWSSLNARRQDNILWLFAEGVAVIAGDAGETRKPYRLSSVLALEQGVWRWRLFHGSEPVAALP